MKTMADCTSATALGAVGVETSMGTIKLSQKARRIIGVWATALGSDTLTSTEAVSGIFRLQSGDVDLAPAKYPLDTATILTSGAVAIPTHIIPVSIPVRGGETIEGFITDDDASTGTLKGRVGVIYEGE